MSVKKKRTGNGDGSQLFREGFPSFKLKLVLQPSLGEIRGYQLGGAGAVTVAVTAGVQEQCSYKFTYMTGRCKYNRMEKTHKINLKIQLLTPSRHPPTRLTQVQCRPWFFGQP